MKKLMLILLAAALVFAAACTVPSNIIKPSPEGDPQVTVPVQTDVPEDPAADNRVTIDTTDVNGSPVKLSAFSDRKVIMINVFETWCPPCMEEIPDLVRLSHDYADRGFAVMGAYAASDEETVKGVIRTYGIDYPVFAMTEQLSGYQTEYVPTTIFIDGNGRILTQEPFIGGRSYAAWEEIILELLENPGQ